MTKQLIGACAAATLALPALAAPVQTVGGPHGTVASDQHLVTFDANTGLLNQWVENGVLVSYSGSGSGNNNGCGYAGLSCYDAPADLGTHFAGNFMATAGNNAYISIRRADGQDLVAVEFSFGSLSINPYAAAPANAYGYWRTLNNGQLTGSGNFSTPRGAVIGVADQLGFDEIQLFAFSANNRNSGYSAPAIDNIRAAVPEPSSMAMAGAGWLTLAWALRRRGLGRA